MRSQRRPLSYDEALSRAAALCARCEQCTTDLRRKMDAWGVARCDADRVICELERLNFVDDNRYARAYAHDKLRFAGWGRNKIMQGLWAKRLPPDAIGQSMSEIDEKEYAEAAKRVILSKIRASNGIATYEAKMKVMRHAVQRGFEPRIASRIINETARAMRDRQDPECDDC